jgi:hypothetical protein
MERIKIKKIYSTLMMAIRDCIINNTNSKQNEQIILPIHYRDEFVKPNLLGTSHWHESRRWEGHIQKPHVF